MASTATNYERFLVACLRKCEMNKLHCDSCRSWMYVQKHNGEWLQFKKLDEFIAERFGEWLLNLPEDDYKQFKDKSKRDAFLTQALAYFENCQDVALGKLPSGAAAANSMLEIKEDVKMTSSDTYSYWGFVLVYFQDFPADTANNPSLKYIGKTRSTLNDAVDGLRWNAVDEIVKDALKPIDGALIHAAGIGREGRDKIDAKWKMLEKCFFDRNSGKALDASSLVFTEWYFKINNSSKQVENVKSERVKEAISAMFRLGVPVVAH